jgi:hypothetical protein
MTALSRTFKKILLYSASFLIFTPAVYAQKPARNESQGASKQEYGFHISYIKPKNKEFLDIYKSYKSSKGYDLVLDEINDTFVLPQNIPVEFTECGEPNAYYDPEAVKVSLCYEFVKYTEDLIEQSGEDAKDAKIHAFNSMMFIMFHEVGHALIDQLEIPVTGKEEDAVDDLASLIMLSGGEAGEEALVSAMLQFGGSADEAHAEAGKAENLGFWDEHSLDAQRFYSIACVLYGSNPEKFSDMIGDDGLPEARAEGCPAEYEQKWNSWSTLLGDNLKRDL